MLPLLHDSVWFYTENNPSHVRTLAQLIVQICLRAGATKSKQKQVKRSFVKKDFIKLLMLILYQTDAVLNNKKSK